MNSKLLRDVAKYFLYFFAVSLIFLLDCYAQQININRIEKMPNIPSPYQMIDWKAVARGYDSLVYNFNSQGEYLPLIFFNNNPVNYPDKVSFGLHSYVGTNSPTNSEAINVLPSIVGASLVGIDKRNQSGYDWVKMSREYFNKRPEMNIYKNSPHDNTYDDWWYESMPNIFFYQLYSLHPNVEDYEYQFRIIADRFLEVAQLSGGSTTPWQPSNFFYRGWDFVNKQPYRFGVEEPEAAGAVAYILYSAYTVTGEKKYLIGAEWCMEYLNSLTANPAYEIQLPYGVYTAARMNAEIGTNYDINKMLNWCFDFTSLRNWNVIVGKWGIYDVAGLIGEDFVKQYAFSMNTFQQIGALVPMVRYDERFARAIGKWVLNAANSSRLFYSKYLDDLRQDSEDWSKVYDPNSYISYEALLKSGSGWPEATGDAKEGGWASTNLSLYSSSSAGYLAAVVDTRNVPMILKLNLNKTDFFQKKSFPSYLLFNPYDIAKTVSIDLPAGILDLYESVSNTFIARSVSDNVDVTIAPNSTVVLVITPIGGNLEYKLNQLMINGVVVDYNAGQQVSNYPPRIKSLDAETTTVIVGKTVMIYCTAVDKDNDLLNYQWEVNKGNISGEGASIVFTALADTGTITVKVIVEDSKWESDSATLSLKVVSFINHAPIINSIKAKPRKINIGEVTSVKCYATDLDEDNLDFSWFAAFGTFEGIGDSIIWTAPTTEGNYYLICTVGDGRGGFTRDSIKVMIRDFSKYQTGNLIAFYPFNGNANDESWNGNNGTISGATFTADRFNNVNSALRFDGINDNVLIKNSVSLNFQNAITISFWIKLDQLTNKELYVISHGSWENRLKISISNNRLRWTIKTDRANNGIKDLDSESILEANKLYNCTVAYDGRDIEVWINGELNAFSSWSGKILKTNFDLTIAQMFPANTSYNFKGVLDDFRIYDYSLLPDQIEKLYDIPTSIKDKLDQPLITETTLYSNYPNPFNGETEIIYKVSAPSKVKIEVFDILGRRVKSLMNEEKTPGIFKVRWDGKNEFGENVSSGVYFCLMSLHQNSNKLKLLLLK